MTCATCGVQNRVEAKFCQNCGTHLSATCPNGHSVPGGARFCDECGAAVGAAVGTVDQVRVDEAALLIAEARSTFEDLKARPMLERMDRLTRSVSDRVTAPT